MRGRVEDGRDYRGADRERTHLDLEAGQPHQPDLLLLVVA